MLSVQVQGSSSSRATIIEGTDPANPAAYGSLLQFQKSTVARKNGTSSKEGDYASGRHDFSAGDDSNGSDPVTAWLLLVGLKLHQGKPQIHCLGGVQ